MFTFTADVPTNIQYLLVGLLQPWIDRADVQRFGIETRRYGLVSFQRTPWPDVGASTVVSPAGEVDAASLAAFAQIYQPGSDMRM
jgi:hypothetical protein